MVRFSLEDAQLCEHGVNLICFTGEVAKMDRPRQRLRSILETLHHGPYLERHGTRRLKHRAGLWSLGSAKVPKLELGSFTSALVPCSKELQSNEFLKTGLGFESR